MRQIPLQEGDGVEDRAQLLRAWMVTPIDGAWRVAPGGPPVRSTSVTVAGSGIVWPGTHKGSVAKAVAATLRQPNIHVRHGRLVIDGVGRAAQSDDHVLCRPSQ